MSGASAGGGSDGASTIRVVLAEDQDLVRGALAALLSLEPDISVVAQVRRGDELAAAVRDSDADVAVVDIDLPVRDGISAAAEVRASRSGCMVLILTSYDRPGYIKRAMNAGATGYLLKDAPSDQLADAVRRVARGQKVIDPTLAVAALGEGDSPLNERERAVLAAVAAGDGVAAIAQALHLSEGTVRNYLSTAAQKCDAHSRVDAARVALEKGWL